MPTMSFTTSFAWRRPMSPRHDAKHAVRAAARGELGRRRRRIEAAIARALVRDEGGDLSLEAQDRGRDDGLAEPHSCIVQEVAGREVVGAVDDHVVRLDELEDVRRVEARVVCDDLHVGVERLDRSLRRSRLRDADPVGRVDHLALEVRRVDDVVVDDPDRPDAGGGEVERGRRAKPSGPQEEHLGAEEGDLALDPTSGKSVWRE